MLSLALRSRSLMTASKSASFVKGLSRDERRELMRALEVVVEPPLTSEAANSRILRTHMLHNALPFVGFGFLDNFVMIVAGEYIDASFGSAFCISTMAAAALGNTLSDVFGIGSAWYVEKLAVNVRGGPPKLSSEQLNSRPYRIAANLGRTLGIIIGCLLGMFPLLFYPESQTSKEKDAKTKETPSLPKNY